MADYLPSNDLEYQAWLSQFITYLTPRLAHFGLPLDALQELSDVATPEFEVALAAYQAARAAALTTSAARKEKRGDTETIVRALVGQIQAYPDTTNEDREGLGIPLRGESPELTDVETSQDRPVVFVDISQRLKHTLRIQNSTPVGPSRGKPAGVRGAEIWVKIGDSPQTPTDCKYYDMATKSPFPVQFDGTDGNKPAHYMLRWVSSTGEKGAWSEVETATIAA
jgi:hypothetical protein